MRGLRGAFGRSIAAVLFLLAVIAQPAGAAEFGIVPGSLKANVLDAEGNPDTRAGVHPDRLQLAFQLSAKGTGTSARDFVFEFGPGLGGSPGAVPNCVRADIEEERCPKDTQVGKFTSELNGGTAEQALYSINPAPNQLATFAMKPFWESQFELALKPSDYGLRIETTQLPQVASDTGEIELWGIPADHLPPPSEGPPLERKAMLTTPTRCGGLTVTFHTRSWEEGAPWLSETTEIPPFTGCEGLPFAPRLGLAMSDPIADTPTGAQIDLSLPEGEGPDAPVNSQIKAVKVDLPPGLAISPGGAEGLVACADRQFGLGEEAPATCPPASRVGSAEISIPQFGEPLSGAIYLGQERPGERFRLFLEVSGRGTELKTIGTLAGDPQTGQLTATLADLPQISFGRLRLAFDGGPHALLATPLSCGPAAAQGHFVPYSGGAPVNATATVSIGGIGGSPCQANPPFDPKLNAGSTRARAGKGTGFSLTLVRQDGEQLAKRFSVTLPSGLGAALGAIEPCSGAAAAAAACPAESRMGSAVAEIGSGASPAVVHGNVFLTSRYKGAPFGLAMVFDASLGPFDLGTLQVRGGLRLDRRTGQITISTDPMPTTFEGVPLRFRTIGMDLDRPGLLRNPTSCRPEKIVSTSQAVDGRVVSTTTPFVVRGCDRMAFRPVFRAALTDPAELHANGHPGLSLGVRMGTRGTNLSRFTVQLPHLLGFRAAAVGTICARGDAEEGACPKRSRIGTGVARTPLLDRPLRGPVYMVQPEGNGLPGVWTTLRASGVQIDVAGRTVRRGGHLQVEMDGLPDMPISSLAMRIGGGGLGLFSLRKGLCTAGRPRHLTSTIGAEAQNEAYRLDRVPLRAGDRCATAHHGSMRTLAAWAW